MSNNFTGHAEKLGSSWFTTHSGNLFPSLTSFNLLHPTFFINNFKGSYDTLSPGYQVRLSLGPTQLTHDAVSYPGITILPHFPRALQCCPGFQARSTRICAGCF